MDKKQLDAQLKLVRTDRIPMRWGEMDALGHMNNAVYFRYFEQARISWFDISESKSRPMPDWLRKILQS